MFVGQEDVLRLVDKNGKEKVYSTTDTENINIPLAVIVNQNSASASEIFASIVMDLNRGEVFGTQTYGKGVVQYVLRIKDHGSIHLFQETKMPNYKGLWSTLKTKSNKNDTKLFL